MFHVVEQAFKEFSTEYRTLQYFKQIGSYVEPINVPINMTLASRRVNNKRQMCTKYLNISVIPLKTILQNILELPGVYDCFISYVENAKRTKSFTSYLQGELWQSIEQQYDNVVLPLILYFDDLEINNPLGTHRGLHKLGVVYCTIGCIPEQYASQLENIFLVQLHNSEDHKQCENKSIFFNIVEQLKELETTGITISIKNTKKKINFVLLHILGDNLGLNTILGFSKSFNCNFSCRICEADKKMQRSQVVEDVQLIRTIENYERNAKNLDKGVYEECTFNSIKNFHAVINISVDLMHDIFEGICRYEIGKILKRFIVDEKIFSLEILNHRIRFFDYGSQESQNTPTLISADSLKKGYIICSASEMACLFYYFGLLIGDLVPKKHEVWEIYIFLRKIVSIVMCRKVNEKNIDTLTKLITEHHKLYCQVFQEQLKFKHHILLHYPRIMRTTGPIKYMSSARFEAKHKELKATAKVITSRCNPSYTLAIKQQLLLNYRFISRKGFCQRLDVGPTMCDILKNVKDYDDFKSVIPTELVTSLKAVSWAQINGTKYKPHMVIKINESDRVGQIKYILTDSYRKVYFVFKILKIITFVDHYYAYLISSSDSWGFILQTQIIDFSPLNIHVVAAGDTYIPKIP
ncbi:uncharacterized protein LOC143210722 [Lasioglossum baleicum]|uniref:uncharacterized protein LOC143210722 n=1 Tax=Lasioglossum baleicum TaxID=434251 RepID=UPI003FCD1974